MQHVRGVVFNLSTQAIFLVLDVVAESKEYRGYNEEKYARAELHPKPLLLLEPNQHPAESVTSGSLDGSRERSTASCMYEAAQEESQRF